MSVPVPTWRLAAVAAVLAPILLALPGNGWIRLVVVDVVLLCVALIDAALAPTPSAVAVERTVPGVLSLGVEGEVSWAVANPIGRTLRVSIADQLAPSLHAEVRRAVRIPSRGRATISTTIRPSRRGRFEIRDHGARGRALGLAASNGRAEPSVLRVLLLSRAATKPSFGSTAPASSRSDCDPHRAARGHRVRSAARACARRRVPADRLVRDRAREAHRPHVSRRTQPDGAAPPRQRASDGGPGRGVPRLEHAMDAVMMMTAVSTRLGDRTGMLAFGRTVRASCRHRAAARARSHHRRDVRPRRTPRATTAPRSPRRWHASGAALVVILTELTEPVIAETLRALPVMVRHHLVLIGGVRDPDVVTWARDTPDDASEAYRKAAAVGAIEDRRRAIARLRGMGATVIDATPGRLAPDLADAYLRVKATGRL
jgi:uncharacterized protein (DUF58 family)